MDGPAEIKSNPTYISEQHARRAVGYLGIAMAVRGYISPFFPFAVMHDLWEEAIKTTTEASEKPPSPIQGFPS